MGDIIRSSLQPPVALQTHFKRLIERCNQTQHGGILSPYKITLGDEFQGLATSVASMVDTIIFLEEECLRSNATYRLRFIALQGEIATAINTELPYGMIGQGLKQARMMLEKYKRRGPRIQFRLHDNRVEQQLQQLFFAWDGLVSTWRPKDGTLILDMIDDANNARVGARHSKNRSQIYKLRRSKMIAEYVALRSAIISIAAG